MRRNFRLIILIATLSSTAAYCIMLHAAKHAFIGNGKLLKCAEYAIGLQLFNPDFRRLTLEQVVVIEELKYTAAEHTPPSAKYRTGRVSQAA